MLHDSRSKNRNKWNLIFAGNGKSGAKSTKWEPKATNLICFHFITRLLRVLQISGRWGPRCARREVIMIIIFFCAVASLSLFLVSHTSFFWCLMIRRGKLCRKCLNVVDATPANLIGTAFQMMGETANQEVNRLSTPLSLLYY